MGPAKIGIRLVLVTALFLLCGIPTAQAQITEIGQVTIDGAKRFHFKAENVDENYQIDVIRIGRQSTLEKLPVIYVLDGNTQFLLVSTLANLLANSRAYEFGLGIPPALVVSIGYVPDPSLSDTENFNNITMQRRHRDYTPVLNKAFVKNNPDLPPHGGAPAFLAFIEEELKPFIANKYPVDAEDQTIIGHSMGGLFVMYVLLNSPTSFDRYIASSPGLAWGDYRPLGDDLRFNSDGRDTPAKLFVSVGGNEEDDMIGTATAATQTLRVDAENLEITFQIFPGENHVSVMPAAVTTGLRDVFK